MARARISVFSILAIGLVLLAGAPTASFAAFANTLSSRDISILYAEPVQFAGLDVLAAKGTTSATPARATFDAYGRRFDMVLEPNDRLRAKLSASTRSATQKLRLLRGSLSGLPGSWVRLTVDGARYTGMIWDGRDLYVLAPASEVVPDTVNPIDATGDAPVVYRLSDVRVAAGSRMCAVARRGATSAAVTTGLDQYQALVSELRQTAAATVTGVLQVSVLADFEFYQANSSSTQTSQNKILGIFNQVDGIFSSQVGVQIELSGNITVFTTTSDPFTSTLNSESLLDEVGNYRSTHSNLSGTGITHLVTGRDLSGNTVGIAYIGTLCESHFSVSLSQNSAISNQALIAAHELGHNFGAPHDGETPAAGEPSNPCVSVPQNFLMAPLLNGSSTFSQCSLDQMAPIIAHAESTNCILPAVAAPDIEAVADNASVGTIIGHSFPISATLTNTGSLSATGVTLNFAVPASVTVSSFASSSGLTCVTAVGGVNCTANSAFASNASQTAQLTLVATAAGNYTVTATATATNDTNAANNVATFSILADTAPDLALEVPASSPNLMINAEESFTIGVRNNGSVPAGSAQVQITLPGTMTFVSATNSATISCNNVAPVVACTMGTINAGAVRSITVRVRGALIGNDPVQATLNSDDDGTAGNNSGEMSLRVVAASSSSGGGGGGGAFDLFALALLGLVPLLRRWRPGAI